MSLLHCLHHYLLMENMNGNNSRINWWKILWYDHEKEWHRLQFVCVITSNPLNQQKSKEHRGNSKRSDGRRMFWRNMQRIGIECLQCFDEINKWKQSGCPIRKQRKSHFSSAWNSSNGENNWKRTTTTKWEEIGQSLDRSRRLNKRCYQSHQSDFDWCFFVLGLIHFVFVF